MRLGGYPLAPGTFSRREALLKIPNASMPSIQRPIVRRPRALLLANSFRSYVARLVARLLRGRRKVLREPCPLVGFLGLGLVLLLGASCGAGNEVGAPGADAQTGRIRSIQEISDWVTVADPLLGTGQIPKYEAQLDVAREHPEDKAALGDAKEALSVIYLRHGKNEEALALLEESFELAKESGRDEQLLQRLRRSLGVACMRVGEADHCIAMHNPDSCLFPIQAAGVWSQPSGAIRAGEYFLEYLQHDPSDLGVRWLLNVASQVAGTHPDGVPEEFLIPLETFDSDERIGCFQDLAGPMGVDNFSLAGGAIMDDIDGDGYLDIFTTNMAFSGSVHYYHNQGDGRFEDWTERAGLTGQLGGLSCMQGDVDGDGLLDIFILRGAWQGPVYGAQRNSLLRQREDGSFVDVTDRAGLGSAAYPTQAGAFADYDLDGDLDLFIGNESSPCQLFTNDGTGRFEDRAEEAGVMGNSDAVVKGVSWGDYDNDGDPDLYVSCLGKTNHLYRNDGSSGFVDVARALGVDGGDDDLVQLPGDQDAPVLRGRSSILARPYNSKEKHDLTFVSWFWDMDNDGWLDLYVGGFGSPLSDLAAGYLGEPIARRRHLRVYRNNRKGGFDNVTREMGIDAIQLPMGANFGDLNNDGYQDFYLGTGRPGYEYLIPNSMYLNVGGTRFVDVTAAAGVGHLQKGHGVAFGDVDNDGDLDIMAQMGGFFFGDGFRDSFFENPGNDNHWITVQLRGSRKNTFGVGARLRAFLVTPEGERQVHSVAGSGASFGASSLQQELGLGQATRLERLEIQWPAGGLQVIEDLAMDQIIRVTEGEPGFAKMELPMITLGGTGE